jgi:hypothetical protein
MINITRSKIENFIDCHDYGYTIFADDIVLRFYQSGNRDLNMVFWLKKNNNTLIVNKEENYLLYEVFNTLYLNIINRKFLEEYSETYKKNFDEEIMTKLITNENHIFWKSDAPIRDEDYRSDMKYNYFDIVIDKEKVILEVTSDKQLQNNKPITIEFNTDRSRYGSAVTPFCKLLENMEKITEPYRQIALDEYAYYLEKNKVKKLERI